MVLVFLTSFNGIFTPTSHSLMYKLFRFSESLGKSNWKKVSQIWKLLLIKGVKSPLQKKFFKFFFFLICSLCLNIFLPPLPKVQCPIFLDFRNPWGKVIERGGLRFEFFAHKWCKIAVKKKVYYFANIALLVGFFGTSATICIGREMLYLPYAGFFGIKYFD